MNKSRRTVLIVLAVAAVALAAWLARPALQNRPTVLRSSIAAAAPAAGDPAGYARALGPRPLTFPADFGPHADFQTEWWYYTGNLTASTGEHFGYQLTFFRRALLPPAQRAARPSDFGAQQVYMAHLALTDVAGAQHYARQLLSRGAAGLAGAQARPYRVWLDDWSVAADAEGVLNLRATSSEFDLKLDLRDLKGPILQGDRGYSRKGPEPGNASHYYSQTRLATQGTITVRGHTYPVDGLSWMDHEYSTSALSQGQVGWDWFSLQLDDNRELMLFQIRRADGTIDPFSSGTLVERDGTTRSISREDMVVRATGTWRSPHTGAVYPSGWQVDIPSAGITLSLVPYLPDQEMNVGYSYWEGAVQAAGQAEGKPVSGSGYVELTGYAGSMAGQF